MNERLVRDVLFPLHERLKGKPTFPWLRELERTQWLPPAALREYQLQRMLALVSGPTPTRLTTGACWTNTGPGAGSYAVLRRCPANPLSHPRALKGRSTIFVLVPIW